MKKRIFFTKNYFTTILMLIYAKNSNKNKYLDILIIEKQPTLTRKQLNIMSKFIQDTKLIHPWLNIEDLNKVNNKFRLKERIKKIVTSLKLKFIQRILSKIQFKIEKRKIDKSLMIKTYDSEEVVELNVLTNGTWYNSIINQYPSVRVNYFEYGLEAYSQFKDTPNSSLYCIYADEFKAYLEKNNKANDNIYGYITGEDFSTTCSYLINQHSSLSYLNNTDNNKKYAFIVLQKSETYYVSDEFWIEFLDACIAKIDFSSAIHFSIVPHPMQSNNTIKLIQTYFNKKKLSFEITTSNDISKILGVEIIFSLSKKNVKYVFSIFSAGFFHISKLFSQENIEYYYGYHLLSKYIDYSNEFLVKSYKSYENTVEEVFSKTCKRLFDYQLPT